MSAKKIPFGYVYEITNTVNGKTYIGQRRLSRDRSWREYLGSGKLIKNAIEKYGKENFVKSFLGYAYSQDELNELEYQSIKKGKKSGKAQYNLYTGPGAGGDTFKNFTPERKEEAYRKRAEGNKKANREGRGRAAVKKRNSEYWESYFLVHGDIIIKLYEEMGSIPKVSSKMGIPVKRVGEFLRKNNVPLNAQNKKGHEVSLLQRAKLSSAHTGIPFNGETESDAKKYLEESRLVIKELKRIRKEERTGNKKKREQRDRDFIYAYMELKLSIEELQDRFNCKYRIIYYRAKKLGLPTPAARFKK